MDTNSTEDRSCTCPECGSEPVAAWMDIEYEAEESCNCNIVFEFVEPLEGLTMHEIMVIQQFVFTDCVKAFGELKNDLPEERENECEATLNLVLNEKTIGKVTATI